MNISSVVDSDFDMLYRFAKGIPELKVSATEEFMDRDEFKWAMRNPNGIFLVAKIGLKIVGFINANMRDIERPYPRKWACLVYLAVAKDSRKYGIATLLYKACINILKEKGITDVYGWANAESDGAIIAFMKKQGFAEGHKYIWMDKEI